MNNIFILRPGKKDWSAKLSACQFRSDNDVA